MHFYFREDAYVRSTLYEYMYRRSQYLKGKQHFSTLGVERHSPVLVLLGSAGHMPDDCGSRGAASTEADVYLYVVAYSHRGCFVPPPAIWALPFWIYQKCDFYSKWNRVQRKLSTQRQVSFVMLSNYWLSIQLTKHWVNRIALQAWFENSNCSWLAVSPRLHDSRQNWAKDLSINQSQSITFRVCLHKIN